MVEIYVLEFHCGSREGSVDDGGKTEGQAVREAEVVV
jgi:hypothetical protein